MFFGALAESLVGLGVVWPGIGLIVLAAAFSADNGESTTLIFVLATLGTAIGDTISYGLGRWGAGWLAGTRFGPTLRVGRVLMEGRARLLIPFYHLTSWTRAVGPVGAGAMKLPLRIWIPLDYLGAVLSSAIWVGVGAIFGAAVLTEDGTLEQHPALRIGLATAAVGWALFLRRAIARASERLEARDRAATAHRTMDPEDEAGA